MSGPGSKGPCGGKIAHATAKAARKAMASLIAKDGSTRMNVYQCPICGAWHVGHRRGLTDDIRKALAAGTAKAARTRRVRRGR